MRIYVWQNVKGVLFDRDPADVAAVVAIARTAGAVQIMLDDWCWNDSCRQAPILPAVADYSREVYTRVTPDEGDLSRLWVFHKATLYGGD